MYPISSVKTNAIDRSNIRSTYVFQQSLVFSLKCHNCCEKKDIVTDDRSVPAIAVWMKKLPPDILCGPSNESFT